MTAFMSIARRLIPWAGLGSLSAVAAGCMGSWDEEAAVYLNRCDRLGAPPITPDEFREVERGCSAGIDEFLWVDRSTGRLDDKNDDEECRIVRTWEVSLRKFDLAKNCLRCEQWLQVNVSPEHGNEIILRAWITSSDTYLSTLCAETAPGNGVGEHFVRYSSPRD